MIELGGQKVTATSDTVAIPYDTAGFARKLGVGKILNVYTVAKDMSDPVPLAISFPGGAHFAGQAQIAAGTVGKMIRAAIGDGKGPVSFGPAGDAGGGRRGLVLIDALYRQDFAQGFGKLEGLDDIDLIAVRSFISHETGCGTYVNSATGAMTSGTTTYDDTDITVHERRTGKEVAHRLFKGHPSCASHTTSTGSGSLDATGVGGGEDPAIGKWLNSQVKG